MILTVLALSLLAYRHLKKKRVAPNTDNKENDAHDPNISDHNVNISHQTIRRMQDEKNKKKVSNNDVKGYKFDGLRKLDDTLDMKPPCESPLDTNVHNNILSLNIKSEIPLKEKK